ncbi:MAG TPA: hypothetical protein DDW52_30410 [Planctomycetaceae bacterium]|nr:hypothetical protein [Planctomycetaceae bacterium]
MRTFDDRSIERIANVVRSVERQTSRPGQDTFGGLVLFGFRLTTDMTSGTADADIRSADDAQLVQAGAELRDRVGLLNNAVAGREGLCLPYRDYFVAITVEPVPVQLRIDGFDFQISHDGGATWATWASGQDCP